VENDARENSAGHVPLRGDRRVQGDPEESIPLSSMINGTRVEIARSYTRVRTYDA